MLSELKVANFAIIDKINVSFKSGFNVLSGETGSGKSILLKSLSLLMGEKSVSDTIKSGAEQATVEGSFDLSKRLDIKAQLLACGIVEAKKASDVDDILVVKRVMSVDGKNRVYINGSLSTLQQLRDIVAPLIEVTGHPAPLIEMTGQHENRNLQSKAYHLDAIDQYLGAAPQRKTISDLFEKRETLRAEILALEESARSKTQRLDFLTYQRDEIAALGLKPGEEEKLENDMKIQRDSKRLLEFFDQSEAALFGDDDSALVRLHRIVQRGLEFSTLDPELARRLENIQQAKSLVEDVVYYFRDYGQKLGQDADRVEHLEDKLSQFRKLQKKYGSSVAEILAALAGVERELSLIENSEENLTRLRLQLADVDTSLLKVSKDLHKARVGAARKMAEAVNSELEDLNMKGLIFSVQLEVLPEPTATGISDVEFLIQNSKKDTARSLAKFASGGELSRILLSLKRVIGASEFPRTYLFDEVDAGVSGVTAEKVGRKLKSIAKGQQVICVTHLPQVAAFAHAHFVIQKSESQGAVRMRVEELNTDDQVREIARMLSGEKITRSSMEHARELLRV
jgi:DNA repair protein RecN (Recombination protein N)